MLSVLTIDLANGLPAIDTDAVVAGGEIVYSSPTSLYVATQRWLGAGAPAEAISDVRTQIHRFDVERPRSTSYVATGAVEGFMLNQWSMSEHEGVLRVASTTSPPWTQGGAAGESESFVTTLATAGDRLIEVGQVGGIGRGEQIYAVRFIGDAGYVVTFRQVDPLYTLDLSDPTEPRVAGELKIPGYSAYLHPVGDGLLLGVGQDANADGATTGVQMSLFDVSDPRRRRASATSASARAPTPRSSTTITHSPTSPRPGSPCSRSRTGIRPRPASMALPAFASIPPAR